MLGGHSLDLNLELLAPQASFSAQEIPAYLVLGVLAGLLGALFNHGILTSLTWNHKVSRVGLPWRVGLAGLVSGLAVALLPTDFRNSNGLREIFASGEAGWQVAAITLVAQSALTLIAYGSGAPGGLFAPALTIGSALGYLVGFGAQNLPGAGVPTTYAFSRNGHLL